MLIENLLYFDRDRHDHHGPFDEFYAQRRLVRFLWCLAALSMALNAVLILRLLGVPI